MQTISTSLQTDTTPTHLGSIFTGRMLLLTPNQQCQSTESTNKRLPHTRLTALFRDYPGEPVSEER